MDLLRYPMENLGSISVFTRISFFKLLGFYENGRRHGEGTFTYPNGDTYSGWWKYGAKYGKGTYNYAKSGMRVSILRCLLILLAVWNVEG